jgi:glycosyltransferase involved in cell wall biosynthesis
MQPLRILHVTPYSPAAWAYGGIPRIAATLTRELARAGHHVTVCSTDACDEARRLSSDDAALPDGVTWRIFPNASNRLAYRWQFFTPVGLGGYLRRHASLFDVAHIHACRNLPGAVAARHLRTAGVPYVLAPNGTAPLIERRIAAKRLFDMVTFNRTVRDASGVLAVSESETRQLAALGIRDAAVHRVPNPVDLEEFTPALDPRAFRSRTGVGIEPVIAYLGQLTPRKRVDVLMAAFARLRTRDVRLVVAGNDGGEAGALRRMAHELGIAPRVTFTGLLTGRRRLELLAAADLVVYPSEHEVFGLVPLEALLAGTPVIVSDDCGCAEVVRATGGGSLVPPGDAHALAHAIDDMLAHPDTWRTEATAAQARVRAQFSPAAVTRTLTDVYRAVLMS